MLRVGCSYTQNYCFKNSPQKVGKPAAVQNITPSIIHQINADSISFTGNPKILSTKKITNFANEISRSMLEVHLKKLTSPEMEGRAVGHPGIERAKEYIAEQFKEIGLEPVKKLGLKDYYHTYETNPYMTSTIVKKNYTIGQTWGLLSGAKEVPTANILGMVKGRKYPNDYLIITAHYDHLGKSPDGIIFPGADDNASSVSALIEIARTMNKHQPEKSVIFGAVSGEEHYKTGATALRKAIEAANLKKNVEIIDLEMLGAQQGDTLEVFKYKQKFTQKMADSFIQACEIMGTKIRTIIPNPRSISNNAEMFSNSSLPAICVSWDYYGINTHPYLHTNLDTFENVNMDILERAAKTIGAASYIHSNKNPIYATEKPKIISTIQNMLQKKEPQNIA